MFDDGSSGMFGLLQPLHNLVANRPFGGSFPGAFMKRG
jgi:hypothetical protein